MSTHVAPVFDTVSAPVPRMSPAQAQTPTAWYGALLVNVRAAPQIDKSGNFSSAVQVSRGLCHRLGAVVRVGIIGVSTFLHEACGGGQAPTTPTAAPLSPAVPQATFNVTQIAVGAGHACALMLDGSVRCWGDNSAGQLGDGTFVLRATAAPVPGLSGGVSSIALGSKHSCALLTTGAVKCWGENDAGQLGIGSTIDQPSPTTVQGLSAGVGAIDASVNHTCVLMTTGGAKCWGVDSDGALGDLGSSFRTTPVDVVGLTGTATRITVGERHGCVILTSGAAKCWGGNFRGQLGNGAIGSGASGVGDVLGLSVGASGISAGSFHTCAFASSILRCWGENVSGQLGFETGGASVLIPRDVPSGDAISVELGGRSTCSVTTRGGMRCWGENAAGQLGNGSRVNSTLPVDVTGLETGVRRIAVGAAGTICALVLSDGAKCWGSNLFGAVGDGTENNVRLVPVNVLGLDGGR